MIEDRIDEIVDDLSLFEDDLDKYEYIIDVGKHLTPLDESLKSDGLLVQGCTSKVWLFAEREKDVLHFRADSNSVIVKGLVSILIKIFDTSSPEEIMDFPKESLNRLHLTEIISPTRQNGVYHMINRIKEYAKLYGGQ